MTESDVLAAISVAVPKDRPQAESLAKGHLAKAVLKIGRDRQIDFNRSVETFTLTSGTSAYKFGVDILKDIGDVIEVADLYNTDVPNWQVLIIGTDDFAESARGSTTTGRPTIATLHSTKTGTKIEFWPEPDAAYNMKGDIRVALKDFRDIPDMYHDTLIDYAIASINASISQETALAMASSTIQDLRKDSRTGWSGGKILLDRHIADVSGSAKCDSGNLRPS